MFRNARQILNYTSLDAAEDDAYSSSGTEAESADGPGGLGFCPPARKEAERIPVVELWYELTERLKDEDIPHPSEFHAEKARIIRCDRPRGRTTKGSGLCSRFLVS